MLRVSGDPRIENHLAQVPPEDRQPGQKGGGRAYFYDLPHRQVLMVTQTLPFKQIGRIVHFIRVAHRDDFVKCCLPSNNIAGLHRVIAAPGA